MASSHGDGEAEHRTERSAGATPPGPAGLPLVGNTVQFVRDPFAFYERCREEFDADVVHYRIAGTDGYMLTHPDDIQTVLVERDRDFVKGTVVEQSIGAIAPTGLISTSGEEWQRDRNLIQPAFYRERIETHAPMMAEYASGFADGLPPGEPVRIDDRLKGLTLDVLAKTLLDVDVRDRQTAIGHASDTIAERFDTSGFSAYLPLWVPTPANLRCKRAVRDFFDAVDEIIAERQAEDAERDDLLSLLLEREYPDGTTMEPRRVRDQLMTFLFAGHETTALTLTYAIFLLATNPEKQTRVHEELDAVCDGRPTGDDLADLDYLERVVQEALRLYPPAFVVFREPTVDVELGGYTIPAGSTLSLPQWNVHRDERWYDDPETFRPDRWTDEFEDDLPEYAYYPFGGGPRHCIGMRFATMEAKLILATLCQRFQFDPVTQPPLDLSMQITLQPSDGIDVIPRAR